MSQDILDILSGLGGKTSNRVNLNFSAFLKIPLVAILFVNILYAALLFLRTKILADTFQSSQTGLIKAVVSIYLVITIIGSILAVLFLLVG